ncbi:unnamed protein product, partial [Vitis vinifera]
MLLYISNNILLCLIFTSDFFYRYDHLSHRCIAIHDAFTDSLQSEDFSRLRTLFKLGRENFTTFIFRKTLEIKVIESFEVERCSFGNFSRSGQTTINGRPFHASSIPKMPLPSSIAHKRNNPIASSMAVGEEMVKDEVGVEEQEKRLMHYSSFHQILLVGEGDFSFSLCLGHSFASASNIVASSLDPYVVLIKMYKKAKSNLEALEKLGASLLFGVDATKMKLHIGLKMRKFDRIIYNFPHASFHGKEDNRLMIKKRIVVMDMICSLNFIVQSSIHCSCSMHRDLVHGFFRNASGMLRANGEIHVNHKTTAPFSHWNLEELASQNSLVLFECVDFKKEDYPGYNNKRGAGSRCDEPFRLGACSTFKFRFSPTAMKMSRIVISAN